MSLKWHNSPNPSGRPADGLLGWIKNETRWVSDGIAQVFRTVKFNFIPDPDAKGFHIFLSRLTNLWKSGWTGQIVIMVILFIGFTIGKRSESHPESLSVFSFPSRQSETPENKEYQWSCQNCGQGVRTQGFRKPSGFGCVNTEKHHMHMWYPL